MASRVKAGEAFVRISADMKDLKKGVDSAKKVMAELKASAQALGKGEIGKSLAIGIHAVGTAVSAAGKTIKDFGQKTLNVGKSLMTFGSRFMAFASIGIAGIYTITKRFVEMGDALNKMSLRTGATVEWLSAMGFAAERSGASIEILEQAIRKLNKSIAEAQGGNKGQLEAFVKLKIDPNSLKNMDAGAQFELVARRLNAVQNQAEKTAIAMQLFGKSGTMLLPMLGDIDALKKKAQELGIIMTKEQADSAAALLDAWTNVKYQLSSIFVSLGEALAPTLKQVAELISKWVVPVRNFIKAHREWFILMAKGLALVLIIGGALATMGAVIAGAGVAVKSIGGGLAMIGGLVKTIGAGTGMLTSTLGAVPALLLTISKRLSFWLNPIAAINKLVYIMGARLLKLVAGIRAMTVGMQNFGSVANRALYNFFVAPLKLVVTQIRVARNGIMIIKGLLMSEFRRLFAAVAGISAATWGWIAGITAVVAAVGYIIYKTDALGKLWQWLKGVFADVCNFFSSKWHETMDGLGDSLSVIWDAALLGNFKDAWSLLCKDMLLVWNVWTLEISDVWDALVANLKNLWAGFTMSMAKGWDWAVNRVLTAFEYVRGKIAYGWEWIASSCKAAFSVVVLWIQNTFDDIVTAVEKTINRMKSYIPANGYTSEDADFDNASLDAINRKRQLDREQNFSSNMTASEDKLARIEQQTQARIAELNEDLQRKMQMYNDVVRQLKDQNDAELTAEMERRRKDIENLKQEIAKETASLKAKNEAMKKENEVQHEEYYKVWEDIEENTAQTAENTQNKEATAEVNAQAISVRWGGLGTWARMVSGMMMQAYTAMRVQNQNSEPKEMQEARESTQLNIDPALIEGIKLKMGEMQELMNSSTESSHTMLTGISEKAQKMLEKLTEMNRNQRRYADNVEQMLTAQ